MEGSENVGYLQSAKTYDEVLPKFREWYKVLEGDRSTEPVESGEIVTGKSTLFKGGNVRVEVRVPHADIFFELNAPKGFSNSRLSLQRHYSVSGRAQSEATFFDVPTVMFMDQEEGVFRFIQNWKAF